MSEETLVKEEDLEFQEVKNSETWNYETDGDQFQGVYIGEREVDGEFGKNVVFEFDKGGGLFQGVFGTQVLRDKMSKVKVGDMVRITYLGKQEPKQRGGRSYHDFKVERAISSNID